MKSFQKDAKPNIKGEAIAYIRVSTLEQEREGLSLEVQKEQIETYAKFKNLNLLTVLSDSASGKDLNREGMRTLLKHCRDGIKHVIVCKIDRLTRSTKDLLALIELFEEQDVTFHSIRESIDTKTALGRFFLTIMGALSEMERGVIAERTKEVLRHKKEKGEWIGRLPLGFKTINKILKKDEGELAVIKRIKELQGKYRGKNKLSLRKMAKKN